MSCSGPLCTRAIHGHGLCCGHLAQRNRGVELTPIVDGRRNRGRQVTDDEALCTRCLRLLPTEAFGNKTSGRYSWCARCMVLHKFGLTSVDYDALLAEQGGGCRICGRPGNPSLHVDHDHSCCPKDRACDNCRRGLLCGDCNRGIGLFRDDPDLIRRAAEYLEMIKMTHCEAEASRG